MTTLRKTALNEAHRALGAKMVDFGGWDMPLNYGSQLEEHHIVRRDAGMFDVSHMTVVDLRGDRVRDFLRHLLANDVAKLKMPGKALYTCMLDENGGIIDDLIVYFLAEDRFRVVVNAATRAKDLAWISGHAPAFDVEVEERADLAMIAVQGPHAREKTLALLTDSARDSVAALGKFAAVEADGMFFARTGYTGEDGFEIVVPEGDAPELWNRLIEAGVKPAGLGARDTLRLEAGMNLYGQDMDESVTPWESGLAWTVALGESHDFIGRAALERQKAEGVANKLVGIVLEGKGVLRHGQRVVTDQGDGEILSGGYSPTLSRSIGFARVPAASGDALEVDIRGKLLPMRAVQYPFVRDGEACEGI